MEFIKILYNKFRNLILYGIIGGMSSGLDFLVYTFLVSYFGLNYLISNTMSVSVGIITSFTLNRKYNFKVTDKTLKRFIMFLSVGLSGMVLSNIILYFCIDVFFIGKILSKLLSIFFVVILQFLVNKYITFKQ